jgi:hypothetical protein
MDVTFANAQDMPENAMLSIRVGDQRRQLKYKDAQTFQFESADVRHPRVAVDIFERVGSKQVYLADLEAEEGDFTNRIVVPRPDGDSRPPVQLDMKVNLKASEKRASSPSKKHQNAIRSNNYLAEHGVQTILTSMMQAVLMQEPEDPNAFMISYLKENAKKSRPSTAPSMESTRPSTGQPVGKAPVRDPEDRLPDDIESLRKSLCDALVATSNSGQLHNLLAKAIEVE